MSWTLVHKRLKIWPEFLQMFHKFYIPLNCQASQTETSKRNSTKLCQTVESKSYKQSAVEKSGVIPPFKNWGKETYICSVFRRLRDLIANIVWTKHDIDNRTSAVESTRGPLHRPKISWTLVYKRLKIGPEFLPTFVFCSVSSQSHTL